MYADEIKIYAAYDNDRRQEVQSALRQSIVKMKEWAMTWGLTLNLNKCAVFHVGEGCDADYYIDGVKLKTCDSVKDLGVLMS
nr:unnamed protein product [Haemonchus contortus]